MYATDSLEAKGVEQLGPSPGLWLDPEVRLDYGQTFVLSKSSYCPLVWHFCSHHDVLIMENVQRRLLTNVYEDYESSYDELLLKAS